MAELEYSSDVRFWLNQIEASQKARKDYYDRGKAVNKRYTDEERLASSSSAHRMNVLWSNVQTISPALYAKTPNPKVQRRYRDKDPVGKWGAIVIERSLGYGLDAYDVDYHIRASVLDYLLPGCGQVWVSYEPEIEGEGTQERIVWEKCNVEHLNWKDYLSSVSRTSDEDWWRGKRVYLTKEQVEKRFDKATANKLSFAESREDEGGTEKGDRIKKVAVWEIWNKRDNQRLFVSSSCPDFLEDPAPPPHKFDGFFPCPRPLLATTTTESTIPVPDFYLYQDQANEIDKLTQRINILSDALKVIGVYSAPLEGEANVFSTLLTGNENKMVPVSNWAMFAQQGGFDGAVDFFPLKDVIDTLTECYNAREQAKMTMYEITGISDIVRGASDASETATAQQIKSQWGSLRIRDRQTEVQRFVRDVMRLKSEIIAERYQLQTLKAMTNCPLLTMQEKQQLQMRQQAQAMAQANPEQAQALLQANPQLQSLAQPLSLDEQQMLREPTWEEVYQLLKDERLRSYRIDIETDSTIQADEVAEKQARAEFIGAMTSFVQAWGPIITVQPKLAPLAGALMTFGARAFKQADALETEIEAMVDMMSQQAMLPPAQQPQDPQMRHEAEMQKGQANLDQQKFQNEQAKQQFELQKLDKEKERFAMEAQRDVEVAKASQPRAPNADEVASAIAPMVQAVQQMVMAITAGQQQQAQMMNALAQQVAQAANSPKEIVVQRDASGRISRASAGPRLN